MDDHKHLRVVGAGGNLDDRRIGVGASMYYPVAVEGALLSMGDAHSAQGDSEFDGEPLTQDSQYNHASEETDLMMHMR